MALIFTGKQTRTIDPYSPVDSDIVSKLTRVFDFDGRGIISGFALSADSDKAYILKISEGVALKDYSVIVYEKELLIDLRYAELTPNVKYNVVLMYKYGKNKQSKSIAYITFVKDTEFVKDLHLKLGSIKVDDEFNLLAVLTDSKEYAKNLVLKDEFYCCLNSLIGDGINNISLDYLCDVCITNIANNDILQYDSVSCHWVNRDISSAFQHSAYFTDLVDTPNSYSGKAGYLVAVNEQESALTFINPDEIRQGIIDCIPQVECLNDLTDVSIALPCNGQVLTYVNGLWCNCCLCIPNITRFTDLADTPNSYQGAANMAVVVNPTATGLAFKDLSLIYANINHSHSLNDLTDVNIQSPQQGDFLLYNGSSWINMSIATVCCLNDLTDVTIQNPQACDIIYYNGTTWTNGNICCGIDAYWYKVGPLYCNCSFICLRATSMHTGSSLIRLEATGNSCGTLLSLQSNTNTVGMWIGNDYGSCVPSICVINCGNAAAIRIWPVYHDPHIVFEVTCYSCLTHDTYAGIAYKAICDNCTLYGLRKLVCLGPGLGSICFIGGIAYKWYP